MRNTYGMKINEIVDINAKYVICHSLERNGLCVFKQEIGGVFSHYCSGPFETREDAQAVIETLGAIDNG